MILFTGDTGGLHRVPSSGGLPVQVTKLDASRQETSHGFPQFLPDGKRFLYFISSGDKNMQGIYAGSLDNSEQRVRILGTASKAIYTTAHAGRTGRLLWLQEQTLVAQPFDAGNLRLEGEPELVAESVAMLNVRASFWASDAGLLVYRTRGTINPVKLSWTNCDGKPLGEAIQPDQYGSFQLAPDERRVALGRMHAGYNSDIWVLEFGRAVMTRLTFDEGKESFPVWSPDGKHVAFSSDRSGGILQIRRKSTSGAGEEEPLTSGPSAKNITDWSADGRWILYTEWRDSSMNGDIWVLPLNDGGKPVPAMQTRFRESGGRFSPDSKWIAYESNESGRDEVYVQSFPPTGGKWQVSTQGGSALKWRKDGKEIFYLAGEKLLAAPVRITATGIETGSPVALFSYVPPRRVMAPYDVSADGQRFLLAEQAVGG